jgi:voltage-gated potassium channel
METGLAVNSQSETGIRDRYNGFIAGHQIAWELAMGFLAVIYVIVGFGSDAAPVSIQGTLLTIEVLLTAIFVLEFASRFAASRRRGNYLKAHAIDLVALLPLARGLRVARLIRLVRLVRAFTSFRRVFNDIDRLADHRALGTLVIAWIGTMFLCSTVFYAVESGANPNLRDASDAVWWGIATLTGGMTNIQAVTVEGRFATGVLLVLGVALFTAITASLVSFLVSSPRAAAVAPASPTPESDAMDALERLAAMADRGVITAGELTTKRAELLARI